VQREKRRLDRNRPADVRRRVAVQQICEHRDGTRRVTVSGGETRRSPEPLRCAVRLSQTLNKRPRLGHERRAVRGAESRARRGQSEQRARVTLDVGECFGERIRGVGRLPELQ
jgi:hypothetical protein